MSTNPMHTHSIPQFHSSNADYHLNSILAIFSMYTNPSLGSFPPDRISRTTQNEVYRNTYPCLIIRLSIITPLPPLVTKVINKTPPDLV